MAPEFRDPFAAAPPDNVVPLKAQAKPKPPAGLPGRTIPEILAAEPVEAPSIVRGLLLQGGITELAAAVKRGKTRFLFEMIRASLEGRPFLGMPTVPAFWLILTEEGDPSLARVLRNASLARTGGADVLIVKRREIPVLPWPQLVAACVDEIRRRTGPRPPVLVIDTLARCANMPADAEKDAGAAAAVMQPLVEAASQGIGVWVHRHDRKGGGEVGESARGSSAFAGDADILLQLRMPARNGSGEDPDQLHSNVRILAAASRFDETPGQDEPLRIRLDAEGYHPLGKETEQERLHNLDEKILRYVAAHPGCTRADIGDSPSIQGRTTFKRQRVQVLLERGELEERPVKRARSGSQGRTHPCLFLPEQESPDE